MSELEVPATPPPPDATKGNGLAPRRLVLLVDWFSLSLTDLSHACGGAVSRSQIHRILRIP